METKATQTRESPQSVASLRSDPKYSDFTIVCEGEKNAVHKCIICPRSRFFAKFCDGGFEESATNRVILHEKPTLVKGVIDYLYTLDYKVELPPPATNLPQQPDGEKARDNQEMSTHMPEDAGAAWDILSFHILIECSSTGSRSSRRKTWQKSWRGRSTRGRSHMRSMKYTTQHPQVTETYETWQWELLWKTS